MERTYSITEDQSLALDGAISDLLALAEAESVWLSDTGGNLIAFRGLEDTADTASRTIAALAAGSYNATRELAGLLQEREFRAMFHQGAQRGLYMQCLSGDFIVLVVFGAETAVGLVKLYVEKMATEIGPVVDAIAQGNRTGEGSSDVVFEMREDASVFM
jgi:predicted regulator of Ras-like GTPase activity (Roadblock/LC7/MglB family)